MRKLRETQVNPVPVIVFAVLLVIAAGYFFVIRPGQIQSKIEKEWVTPEAAYARHDGRKSNPDKEQLLQQLRAKEGANPNAHNARRRDRE